MRVLVLGGAGMLGHKVCQVFRRRFDTWATVLPGYRAPGGYQILDADHLLDGVDAFQLDTVVRAMAEVRPDAVINGIGIIKHLRAAKDPIVSLAINSLFPHQLANLCRACGCRLVHMSTDCVFSGRKGMYTEADVSDAEDLYGRTKYLGEVDAPGCLTVRTSIIGRELDTSNGLIEWFLAQKGGKVPGYRRAVFTGFTTAALARILADVLENHPQLSGLYHVSSDPITKFDLLSLVNEVYGLGIRIEPDCEFTCDRSLDSSRFRSASGFRPPTWEEMIQEMHRDPTPYDDWRNNES
jgi:dTDP-4-dehydrorhamnose reductase